VVFFGSDHCTFYKNKKGNPSGKRLMMNGQSTFKKFLKTVTGPIALVIIVVWILVALFAVILSPDKSPLADNINGNLALRPPGTEQVVYKDFNSIHSSKTNWFSTHLWGEQKDFEEIPVYAHSFQHDTAQLVIFDRGVPKETLYIPLNKADTIAWKDKHFITRSFPWGSDKRGRDLKSQIFHGARISILVGFFSLIIALSIGITLGLVSGYYGGKVDRVIQFVISVMWTLPTFVLVLAFSVSLGKGLWQMMLAIGLVSWVDIARLVRGQVLSIKEKEYIQATKILGFSDIRILFKHILPVLRGNILIVASSNFASAILLEAGLSFLGMGVAPPTPSWGMIIQEHFTFITFGKAYLALIPGICLASLVLSVNLLSNALRDVFDERQ
jgi:peptide/nickel transport system permease protein